MIQIGDKVCTDGQEKTIRFAIEVLNAEIWNSVLSDKDEYLKSIRELREMFDEDRST